MPWKETKVMDQKLKFVVRSFEKNVNFTALCKEFGIAPKTGYKWKERFLKGGVPAMEDLPRTPLSNSKSIEPQFIYDIIKIKEKKRSWGAGKIRATLQEKYPDREVPSERSIGRVLFRTGFIKRKRRRKVNPTQRIQHRVRAKHPNHVWTVDFKGWWFLLLKGASLPPGLKGKAFLATP